MFAPIKKAKELIEGAINAIKGFFSGLKLEFPKIKMPKLPRFKLNGEFSLMPPSVPKISIDWFAKGGIMTRPTAFGLNGNRLMVGGEAGPEAILPLNEKTLGEIGRAITKTMGNNNVPTQIVVQSILDGRIIAETITPFILGKQQDLATISAKIRGVEL